MPREPLHAGDEAAAVAALARLAQAFGRFRLVMPAGALVGPFMREAMTLLRMDRRGRPVAVDLAAPPILVTYARIHLLQDRAASAGLFPVPESVLAPLRAGRGLVVLDGGGEGGAISPARTANMHAALAVAGIAPGRAVWLQQNRTIAAPFRAECARQGIEPMHVLTAHAHGAGLWQRLMLDEGGPGWRFGFAVAHDRPRRHRWVCLNYALRAHRALLATWLLARPEPGFLSFSVVREAPSDVSIVRLAAHAAVLDPGDPDGARAAVARLLGSGLHLASDLDAFAHRGKRVYSLPVAEVAASELFIVTETEMAGPGLLRWTEKTLKALASGLPFVVFGNAGVIAGLTVLGFDTLGDLVDHGYDSEPDPARRYAAARSAVARFLARPPGFTPAEMARLRAASEHNRAVFAHALLHDALLAPLATILDLAAS
jgi:hypothetical protein